MKEYLTEETLGNILDGHFLKVERQYKIGKKYKCDFYIHDINTVVEFDGYRHYNDSTTISRDQLKDNILIKDGINVKRIPYFVQLTPQMFKFYFDIEMKPEFQYEYSHGFIDKKAMTPDNFNSEGYYRYKMQITTLPVNVREDIKASINDNSLSPPQFVVSVNNGKMKLFIIDVEKYKFYEFTYTDELGIRDINFDPRLVYPEYTEDGGTNSDSTYSSFHFDDIDGLDWLLPSDFTLIKAFIENGFNQVEYTLDVEYIDNNIDNNFDHVLDFWGEYKTLNGVAITSLSDFSYFCDIFFLLTGSRVGLDYPLYSETGFKHFENILNDHMRDNNIYSVNNEAELFFTSIDNIHAYT